MINSNLVKSILAQDHVEKWESKYNLYKITYKTNNNGCNNNNYTFNIIAYKTNKN